MSKKEMQRRKVVILEKFFKVLLGEKKKGVCEKSFGFYTGGRKGKKMM